MKKTNWGLFAKFVFEDTKTCGHWAEDFRFSISQFDVKLTCCVRKTFHQEVASFDLFQTSNRIPRFISNLCERPTWISHGVVHFWSVLQPIRQIFEHLYENRLFYLPTKESEQKTKKKKGGTNRWIQKTSHFAETMTISSQKVARTWQRIDTFH